MNAPVAKGDVLDGKYRVERILGSGGMGVVVEATHLALGERVALKFLRDESAQIPSVVERFSREARAMIRIKSEHVGRVLDVGQTPAGAPYLVMEYLDGRDLSAILEQHGSLPMQDAVDILLQAGEAVAEAHSLGIVHRDLKPANLFLVYRADGTPSVKLLDFGISKVAHTQAARGEMSLTRTAMPLGSPLYMAPEQIASAHDADARSDIWSMGAMLYELLTGKLPFDAETVSHLQFKILQEPPVPLRSRDPDLPEGLEAAVHRCLRKNPDERFRNVAELAEAIAPFGATQAAESARRIAAIVQRAEQGPPAQTSVPTSLLGYGSSRPASQDSRPGSPGASGSAGGRKTPAQSAASAGARPPTPESAVPDKARTASAWGTTHKPSHGSRWLLLSAAPVVLAIVTGLAWWGLRSPRSTAAIPPPDITATEPEPLAAATAETPPAPSEPPVAVIAQDASPEAAASALPPPASSGAAATARPPRTHSPPRASTADDPTLFNTRK